MKCEKCWNEIKVKEAMFCPFCGAPVEQKEELAGYTRGQFFSVTGDEEFFKAWEEVKNMDRDEALKWLRGYPIVHYVYRIFAEWEDGSRHYRRFINKDWINSVLSKNGKIYAQKAKLPLSALKDIGYTAFLTKEECNAAIEDAKK